MKTFLTEGFAVCPDSGMRIKCAGPNVFAATWQDANLLIEFMAAGGIFSASGLKLKDVVIVGELCDTFEL